MANFSRICVIGLGYIGLPTAVLFANQGVEVVGVDVNQEIVTAVNSGKAPNVEPQLDILLKSAIESKKLRATIRPEQASAFILAVPTPCDEKNFPDLTFLREAADSIAPFLNPSNLIVIESTIPIGTTEAIANRLAITRPDLIFPGRSNNMAQVNIAHSPERVLPGKIIQEFTSNDRVIGGMTPACSNLTAKLYRLATVGNLHQTNARTAEMVKLSENAYRDINIAFANELSLVASKLNVDVWEVIKLANQHPRVNILSPGPGVGGHCIPVDPWFIANSAPNETPLIQTARNINDNMPEKIVNRIIDMLPSLDSNICCLGLTYKGNVNDLRGSPAVRVIQLLINQVKGNIYVSEPYINTLPPTLSNEKRISLVNTKAAIDHSAVVVLLTDHQEFIDLRHQIPETKIRIDTRGVWAG
ncbi:MAG: UDP-N-acetyl-D-mannosamine dehydrogenase [Alphaproteobacteria bacterium MarineAlpha3_Bin5]|nr:UDP-N-acetyl-D-mannosamine dehydrogenase [Magnetovibrio sp.]PPR77389.1 MAG: UDP-N-acetyl-D-mannosamine dehydrogenase [Alphaproteobacteria bacterium MarineAlpha3_Bin5]